MHGRELVVKTPGQGDAGLSSLGEEEKP
jgi:hypothetical protein